MGTKACASVMLNIIEILLMCVYPKQNVTPSTIHTVSMLVQNGRLSTAACDPRGFLPAVDSSRMTGLHNREVLGLCQLLSMVCGRHF